MSTAVTAIAPQPTEAKSAGRTTNKLTFGADAYQLIESLAKVGGYQSVEDFCEQAAHKEAQRQHEEYRKLRGNLARRKG